VTGGITLDGLTKRYGPVTAVDALTVTVEPGVVTGFLGPNGAGKTTTLRMLLGLVTPTAGRALVDGRRYAELPEPRRVVGALLETTGFHPGRRGRDHLRILAEAAGLPGIRVETVLARVGLTDAAGRRVGGYSLGMRQRLGLAAALLGDPPVLVLDEPANGLDPAGIADLRDLLRGLAAEGRTVLMSSHVLREVEQTADTVVIVADGRLRHAGPLAELTTAQGETLEAAFLRLTDPAAGARPVPAHGHA
jgi:ABC-2 type transport system ATP-binding protein